MYIYIKLSKVIFASVRVLKFTPLHPALYVVGPVSKSIRFFLSGVRDRQYNFFRIFNYRISQDSAV